MCWELRRWWSEVVGVLWTANTSPWMSTRPACRASPYEAQNRATQMRSVLWQCSGWIYVAVERKSATRIAPAGCSSWEMHKIFSAQKPTVYYASHPLTHRPTSNPQDVYGKAQLSTSSSSLASAQKSCNFLSYNYIIINLNGFRSNGRISCEMVGSRGTKSQVLPVTYK